MLMDVCSKIFICDEWTSLLTTGPPRNQFSIWRHTRTWLPGWPVHPQASYQCTQIPSLTVACCLCWPYQSLWHCKPWPAFPHSWEIRRPTKVCCSHTKYAYQPDGGPENWEKNPRNSAEHWSLTGQQHGTCPLPIHHVSSYRDTRNQMAWGWHQDAQGGTCTQQQAWHRMCTQPYPSYVHLNQTHRLQNSLMLICWWWCLSLPRSSITNWGDESHPLPLCRSWTQRAHWKRLWTIYWMHLLPPSPIFPWQPQVWCTRGWVTKQCLLTL